MVTYKREVENRKKNIETDRRNSERNWKKIKTKNGVKQIVNLFYLA